MSANAATMTLADFITEAALYPYSKERFNLIKECNEFELMALCLDSTDFVTESYNLSAEMVDNLSVLTESGEFTEAGEFRTKITEKGKKIWQMLVSGWNKLISAIVTAFDSLVKFVTKRNSAGGNSAGNSTSGNSASSNSAKPVTIDINELTKDMPLDKKTILYGLIKNTASKLSQHADKVKIIFPPTKQSLTITDKIFKNATTSAADVGYKPEPFTNEERQLFASAVTHCLDGNKIRIPVFSYKVATLLPKMKEVIDTLSNEPDDYGDEALMNAVTKIESLTADLKRLNVGNTVPTVETISKRTVIMSIKELEDLRDKLKDAQLAPDTSLTGLSANGSSASADFNRSVAEFRGVCGSYVSIAIQAVSNTFMVLNLADTQIQHLHTVLS